MRRYVKEFANDMIAFYQLHTNYWKAITETGYTVGAYERDEISGIDAIRKICQIYDEWNSERK